VMDGKGAVKRGTNQNTYQVPILLLTAFFLIFYLLSFRFLIDDAFITFRYSSHLAAGYGLVFNVGGERVEGYSNFLWMAILALCRRLGFDIVGAAKTLQDLCAAAAIPITALCYRAAAGKDRQVWQVGPVAASALLVVNLSFLVCTQMGLETALFALLVITGTWRFLIEEEEVRFPWSGLVFAMAAMTRPEGFIFPCIIVFRAVLMKLVLRRPVRYSVQWTVAFAGIYVPYFAWRWTYFGHLFPNTYYAKVKTSTVANLIAGLRYCMGYICGYGWRNINPATAPMRWVAVVPAFLTIPSCKDPKRLLLLGVAGGYVSFIALSGGDWMPYNRFFANIAPVLAILAVMGVEDAARWCLAKRLAGPSAIRSAAGVMIGLMVAGSVWIPDSPFHIYPVRGTGYAICHPSYIADQIRLIEGKKPRFDQRIGEWMKDRYPPDSLFSTELAGALPYYSGLPTLDTFGLNSTKIADLIRYGTAEDVASYVLDVKPAIFSMAIQSQNGGTGHQFGSPYDKAVFVSPEFRRLYSIDAVHRVKVGYKGYEEMWVTFFVLNPNPPPTQNQSPFTLDDISAFADLGRDVYVYDARSALFR
ncbi:MAG: hypothetical protein J7M12_06425, partial [Candidatus Hydrogenedentes bacterium]|nr:hypothetical protein [Candidatus Hydrogenedentota bacterium]